MSCRWQVSAGWMLPLLLAMILGASVHADEGPRVWTNTAGKKVTGVMIEKGEDWVAIEIKGKVHKIKLASLSEQDQEYVRNFKFQKPLAVTTEVKSRRASDIDFDVRTLKVNVENIEEGKELYCLIVWISQLRTNSQTGVKSHVEAFYSEDDEYTYECSFSNNAKVGQAYRGFALRIIDEDGKVITEQASSNGYLRYLDKVYARQAPKPKSPPEGKGKGKGK